MQAILQKYRLTHADLLGQGVEATVYRYDAAHVLKLYQGTASRQQLQTLQTFYATLDAGGSNLQLPQILHIWPEAEAIVTIEKYLPGKSFAALVAAATVDTLPALFADYLAALQALQQVKISPEPQRYKLFDESGVSLRANGDFYAFLWQAIGRQVQAIGRHLEQDVVHFADKRARLRQVLAQPYEGALDIVHGDFFPGNLLVDEEGRVTTLLDFGLFTMFGDSLFDLATGWVFFDMYDALKLNIRQGLLEFILAQYGQAVQPKLNLYVLVYSILGANAYSNCTDGHYAWCVANLNDATLWTTLPSIDSSL
ncbi:MAG: aminoglycoside phosphotransferase family protein [Caldilineaceae bacterium]